MRVYAIVWVAVAGFLAVMGPGGIVAVGLLVASSAPAVRWFAQHYLPRQQQQPERSPHEDAPLAVAAVLRPTWWAPSTAEMTDAQLCRAWRASFTALQHSRHPTELTALVDARAGYLDEIERRHPDGFGRWMASGALAASDPGRYVSPAPDPSRERDA